MADIKLALEEKYEKETGDMEPNDTIGFHEWYQRYVRWLEKQVEKQR